MPTFAEFIAESFQSEVQLIWKIESLTGASATFKVKSVLAEVSFEQREIGGPWYLSFDTVRPEQAERTHIAFAFRIFNGVFQAVREFVETRQPALMIFASKDEDLTGIYETYLRREKPKLTDLGYDLEGPHRIEPFTEFIVRRNKPSDWKS